ncbi:hypothetical protein [Nonomuraea sp. LPB2021202275-12-8]|uniref:hypothetical protein n=1 Tax=Nonomuraea sp. LPB2021202275-12-8 TaxID=3120159 RepID=UPI00300D2069
MRRRGSSEGRFLTRTPQEWHALMPYQSVAMMDSLPKLAGGVLAARGMLASEEVARLERIAAGVEGHPTIGVDAAGRILGRRS